MCLHASKTSDPPLVALGHTLFFYNWQTLMKNLAGVTSGSSPEGFIYFCAVPTQTSSGLNFQIKLYLRCKQIEVLEIPSTECVN